MRSSSRTSDFTSVVSFVREQQVIGETSLMESDIMYMYVTSLHWLLGPAEDG